MKEIRDILVYIFGLGKAEMTAGHMIARAVLLYGTTLIIIKIGDKRFLGKNSAFDIVLGVIVGSAISRAINGTSAVFATLSAVFILVMMHHFLSKLSYKNFRPIKKFSGHPVQLVRNGEFVRENMSKTSISEEDFYEQLRIREGIENKEGLKNAYLERNGIISFCFDREKAEITDLPVEEGIKTIRIKTGRD